LPGLRLRRLVIVLQAPGQAGAHPICTRAVMRPGIPDALYPPCPKNPKRPVAACFRDGGESAARLNSRKTSG